MLAGARVEFVREAGPRVPAPLLYASPTQINFTPPVSFGEYAVEVWRGDRVVAVNRVVLNYVAPALFAANSDGQGAAAAVVQRVKADGTQAYESILERGTDGRLAVKPIDLGPEGERVYLLLFGTGIVGRRQWEPVTAEADGAPLQVAYAGAQGQFVGLDQINVLLPRTLAGKGEVSISISVSGLKSNSVTVRVAGGK
jgi:uncharacterized protein (TIGR03437 family)